MNKSTIKTVIISLFFILFWTMATFMVYEFFKNIKEKQRITSEKVLKSIKWVDIPAGSFLMGSPDNEESRKIDEGPQHIVILPGFMMSAHTITFEQYDSFCEATKREKPKDKYGRGQRPVINVSWHDAKAFADWLGCRLPTEAEWEYACRAGSKTAFNTGEALTDYQANFVSKLIMNSTYYSNLAQIIDIKPVGRFAPNAWRLYDMHGNVWEWCNDWYGSDYYSVSPDIDPQGPASGTSHIIRGGSSFSKAGNCRSAFRGNDTNTNINEVGFRIVRNNNPRIYNERMIM